MEIDDDTAREHPGDYLARVERNIDALDRDFEAFMAGLPENVTMQQRVAVSRAFGGMCGTAKALLWQFSPGGTNC